ncbi:isoprenylcysteine carboxylmethyltransferase family protein [Hyphomicrobium sp.]|uniref:methyltransferase family protein n=1 Tax=Hyphomicrobium sp. TaxID=82 RepID=UPI002E310454|nr:isoprenylcysteine carboxylmethyltransferase family protein [Hyphomicrobium sp.]HEX2840966.1 isoprenylcysteine carboxylmethyltransferase family protein [Hyphomicrobium sp.]
MPVEIALVVNMLFLGVGAWASARHFARKEREPRGATLLTIATIAGTGLNVWHAIAHRYDVGLDADLAIAISLAAFILFFAAVRATQNGGLSLAFSDRTPDAVVDRGIYRIIRHPFYASYILYWLSWLPLTSFDPSAFVMAGVMVAAYKFAARKEERLLTARLGESYATFAQRTWRFLPGVY